MTTPDTPNVPNEVSSNGVAAFNNDLDTRPVWDENASLAAVEKAMQIMFQDVTPDGSDLTDQREPLMWEFVNMLNGHVQRLNHALDEIGAQVQSLKDTQDGSQERANNLRRLTHRSTNLSHRRDAFAKMHQTAAETYRTQTGNIWSPRDSS